MHAIRKAELKMTPGRILEIAQRLETNCSAYQEKTIGEYRPCQSCKEAADDLRRHAKELES